MSTLVFGAIVTGLVIWFIWRNKAPVLTVWFALVAGLTVGAGLLASAAQKISNALLNGSDKATGLLFGVGVPAVLAVILTAELVNRMSWRNRDKPHRFVHPILAFLAPVLWIGAGGVFAWAAGWADTGVDLLPELVGSFTTR